MSALSARKIALFSGAARPSLDLNFLAGVLDPRITFTRAAGPATYFDAAGVLQTAGTNVPRFDTDPATLAARGMLIEEARTNLLLNSATLSTQTVTVAAVAHTLSFYGTGTVTLSGVSTAGPLVGTSATAPVVLTFTPTAGSLVCTVTGSATMANLEAGAFRTSYITTAGAAATRAADTATMPVGPWFNAAQGTLVADAVLTSELNATAPRIFSLSDGTTSNLLELFVSLPNVNATQIVGGSTQINANAGTFAQTLKAGMAYRAGSQAVSVNGATPTAFTGAGVPTVTLLTIGNRFDGIRASSGAYRRVRYWPRALSTTQLQAATR